MVAARGRYA